jgi:hypothetical protein
MIRILAPFHRWFSRRPPPRLRVIEGGQGAPVVTLVPARTFDELDPDPFSEAFGDVVAVPFEGRVK